MAFQFIHSEQYAKTGLKASKKSSGKGSARGVVSENLRKQGYCYHVASPQEPKVYVGNSDTVSPVQINQFEEWIDENEELAEGATIETIKGIRKKKSDSPWMSASVASYPYKQGDPKFDEQEYQFWKEETIKFMSEESEGEVYAIEHLDESHPHLHIYTKPKVILRDNGYDVIPNDRMSIAKYNQEQIDKEEKISGRHNSKSAYRIAGIEFQDDYQEKVSVLFGHARKSSKHTPHLTYSERNELQQQRDTLASKLREAMKFDSIKASFNEFKEKAITKYKAWEERLISKEKQLDDKQEHLFDKEHELNEREKNLDNSEKPKAILVEVAKIDPEIVKKAAANLNSDSIQSTTKTKFKK